MSSELLLILIVALIVFGPTKLPMLAEHLGKLLRYFYQFRTQASEFWQTQLREQQLQENTRKAETIDKVYQVKREATESDSVRSNEDI